MCRHLGYLGPPEPVDALVTRGPHALYVQSWAPRDMRRGGRINADGFGVAWWPAPGTVTRYRNAAPIWTDPAVTEVLGQIASGAVVAAVRSATVGMPVERAACAPFTSDGWAFSLNGKVPGWREVIPDLASGPLWDLECATDSAALWMVLRRGLAAAPPAEALANLVAAVLRRAPDSRLNLLLGDGETLWATTVTHSLSALVDDDCAVLSSEPYDDDPRWRPIPDHSLVTARPGHLSITPLE
ncbi:MAG: ergothioneine biosynthesis protein EgtC [Mycobacteriaceae bacterium]|nr:ergothioneine biosynthesis protein EgtC [Mycobacteriaceae bacterium]